MTHDTEIGKFIVLADYSHTDRRKLLRCVTRLASDKRDLNSYASIEAKDMKRKSRHGGKRIYVMQIVEVLEVDDNA